ncbi:MAG: hypothetical protein KKI08_02960 [Armatimonadetes bacterium]|nr:hypothetical protein [Armatimonadota bacterium]
MSTGLEMGYLYVAAAGWGIGTGIWIDAEAEVGDPGLMLIAPAVIGVAAPMGVFLIDRFAYSKGMPEGLPSAVATGLLVGGGEGLGIASLQWVRTKEEDAWGFKGLARAEVLASTLGGGAGYGLYYALRPVPQPGTARTTPNTQFPSRSDRGSKNERFWRRKPKRCQPLGQLRFESTIPPGCTCRDRPDTSRGHGRRQDTANDTSPGRRPARCPWWSRPRSKAARRTTATAATPST